MKKILVIDDNHDILEAVELIMTSEGYETLVALDGNDVCKKAIEFKPDLIILDYLLSGYDGKRVCEELRKNEATRSIPIIMISAHPKAKDAGIECGAESFLPKPFSVDDLLQEVNRFINQSSIPGK